MRKQFFRVKQLADQTFSRAGKTEALSDDLINAEKRIESLNKTCQNISKKILSTLLGIGQDITAREKRFSKSQEYILAEVLSESCTGDLDEILKNFLFECSEILEKLAKCSVDTDMRIETSVLVPLQQIIDNDVPNIMKQKRYLTRLILDMDSAKNRYHAAMKHTLNSNSTGNITKAESIKDELEEIEMKVEQCRDSLACDMFQLISKEAILTNVLLDYIKLQQAAHRTALALLDGMVPELESKLENSQIKPVFGLPLEEHLKITNRRIAYPLELCTCVLLELGMEEEGLFRMAGGTSKIRRLKFGLDINFVTMDTAMEYRDVHVFSSVLKSYFRELPEPLLTYYLYDEWLASVRYSCDEKTKLSALWTVLHKLPQANFDNLRYFIKFLSILTKKQDFNKMSAQNLAIVIAPNLIWNPNINNANIGENMNLANQYSCIIEYLVKYADWFFPGDETFYVSIEELDTRTKQHTRSNSADMRLLNVEFASVSETNSIKRCQSTTSLEEQIQNCPLPESPKPITRTRKNKPAPIPPAVNLNNDYDSVSSASVIVSTLPNTSTSPKDKSVNVKCTQQTSKKQLSSEDSISTEDPKFIRRESFNFGDHSNKIGSSDNGKDIIFKDLKTRINIEGMQLSTSADITKSLSPESLKKILEVKKLTKPVPAPRISLESQSRTSINDDVVTPKKPIIPEKPTTLPRPASCSFKSLKISESSDNLKVDNEKNKGPSLEKAHLYSVDKQQVSFIDIASNSDDNIINDFYQDNSSLRSQNNASNFTDKNVADKSGNLVKLECDRGQNSSHMRALSDGHNIDTLSSTNSLPMRNIQRIQRPIPPPPPPPISAKPQSRSGSVGDSTNL